MATYRDIVPEPLLRGLGQLRYLGQLGQAARLSIIYSFIIMAQYPPLTARMSLPGGDQINS